MLLPASCYLCHFWDNPIISVCESVCLVGIWDEKGREGNEVAFVIEGVFP